MRKIFTDILICVFSTSMFLPKSSFSQDGAGFLRDRQASFSDSSWKTLLGKPNDLYDYVYAIAPNDSTIFVGGAFPGKKFVAQWIGNGWVTLGGGTDGPVYAMAIVGNDLYVGGTFTKAGNLPANNIAKWNFLTQSWSALESNGNNGINGWVSALAVRKKQLYVGGSFSLAGNISVNNIVKWNTATKTWSPLGEGVNGSVKAIAIDDTEIYVGGNFDSTGTVAANNIARWNGRRWFKLRTGVNNTVRGIAAFQDDIYVCGEFTRAGNVGVNYVAKWNRLDKIWSNLEIAPEAELHRTAFAIASNETAVYIGVTIYMQTAPTLVKHHIVKWDPVHNSWSTLGSGVRGDVLTIVPQWNDIYVGGGFISAGGKQTNRIAIWHEPASRIDQRNIATANAAIDLQTEQSKTSIPSDFVLLQNYPNPFNPTTLIRFGLPSASEVTLEVFDLSGQRVATLLNEHKSAGFHAVEFNAAGLSSGTYFYRILAGSFEARKKLLLLR